MPAFSAYLFRLFLSLYSPTISEFIRVNLCKNRAKSEYLAIKKETNLLHTLAANADILFELGRKTLQNDVSRSKSCILLYTCFVFHTTYTTLCKKYCCIELPIVMKTKQKKVW